jgi:hypothetical protein
MFPNLLIDNKFYQDIDVKDDLLKIYKDLKEKVYSLNPNLKNFTLYFILIRKNLVNNLFFNWS